MELTLEATEELVRAHLKGTGRRLHFSTSDRIILQAFLATDKPQTSIDVLYAVKKLDPMIGHQTVMKFLDVLVDCGLARLISASRSRGPRMFQPLKEAAREPAQEAHQRDIASGHCEHRHLVCKDCGAVIDRELANVPDAGDSGHSQSRLIRRLLRSRHCFGYEE